MNNCVVQRKQGVIVGILPGIVIPALLVRLIAEPGDITAAPGRSLKGHVPSAVKALSAVGRLPSEQRLDLAIGLPLRNEQALTNLLHRIYDAASPDYRHYLAPEQFT